MKLSHLLLSAALFVSSIASHGGVDDSSRSRATKRDEKTSSSHDKPLSLVLNLNDGSVLKGVPSMDEIPVQTSFANVKIPLQSVLSIELTKGQETIKIRLRNGDQLQGITKLENIQVQALFGKIEVPIMHVVSISVQGGGESSLPPHLLKGLVLYYSFDQDEGEKVTDKSGGGHHGTVHGAAFASNGKIAGACEFNGRDSYVSILNSKDFNLNLNAKKTFSLWWKPHSLQSVQTCLLSRGDSENQSLGFNLYIAHGKYYYLPFKIDHWAQFEAPLVAGEWHHVAVTKQNRTWKIYHNGHTLPISRNMGWPFNGSSPLFFSLRGRFERGNGFLRVQNVVMYILH